MDLPLTNVLLPLVVVLGAAALLVGVVALYFMAYRSVLNDWARRSEYTILHSEARHLLTGPFFLRTANSQQVYRVTIRDKHGTVRKGWVRCGGFWLGFLSSGADVEWDRPEFKVPPSLPNDRNA